MTTAVCFHCGHLKFGSFCPCDECQQQPQTDNELIVSLAMSDHYLDRDALERIGKQVRERGQAPRLDPASHEKFRQILDKVRASGAFEDLLGESDDS